MPPPAYRKGTILDERAVRAAVDRIEREAHGLYVASGVGTGEACRLVPISAIAALVEAISAEPEPSTEHAD